MYSNDKLKLVLRKFYISLALGAVLCFTAAAQDTRQLEFRSSVAPFLTKHCVSCHNDKARIANLSLEHADGSPGVWDKVLDKLSTGRMPPPGSPPPASAEVAAVRAWIETAPGRAQRRGSVW